MNPPVPSMNDYLRLQRLATDIWNYETVNEVSRDDAITAVCENRFNVGGNIRGKRGRARIHDVISSLESHCAMKVAGLL